MTEPTIEDTIAFIKVAHAGQVDKGGEEYWKHPVSVMNRLHPDASYDAKLVALLHDVIEDTEFGPADLNQMGYPPIVIACVTALTKPAGIDYLDYVRGLADSGYTTAMVVKIADNQDNIDPERLARLPEAMRGGDDKYRRSIEILTAALQR
jgi:(p)ppGpp synthase/HD superfamily hydrolase